ncbi:MAG: PAS domain S-box protein [Bacteroidota bacterium]
MKTLDKKHFNKFLNKPFLTLLILYISITALLLIVGFYYYGVQKEKIVNDRFGYLGSIAKFRLLQIEDWLKEKYVDLEILRVSSPLNSATLRNVSSPENFPAEVEGWLRLVKSYYGYDDIMLFNNKFVYSLSTTKKNISPIDSLMCKTALESHMVQFSDTNEKTAAQEEIKFYVPLKDQTRLENGSVLILILKAKRYFEPVLGYNINESPTTESLLLKPFGDGVIYLNAPRFADVNIDSGVVNTKKALIETKMIEGRRGFAEGIDYKDDEVIAVIQKIPSTAWYLFTKINKSEFYEPVTNLARIVFLAVMSADLLFAFVLIFIWRKNIVANYKKIYTAEIEKFKMEKRFESLVNGVKDMAIFILDADGNIISWNDGAEKIEGYTSREIIGKHFSIFYPKDEKLKNYPAINLKEAIEKEGIENEGWRVKKDGTTFWANSVITPLKDEDGKVYGFLKITRDLTEKRKDEEEIRNSRDFYLKLLDDFPNPVWRSGLDGEHNYFNKAWLNFTGRAFELEMNDGWISGIHPEDQNKIVNEYHSAFRQRKEFKLEYRLKNARGEYRWFVDFGMPYYDFKGEFAGYLGSCYDINDRIKYEDTINTLLRINEKLYSSLEINQILDSLVTESIQLTDAASGFACIKNEAVYHARRYYNNDHWEYLEKVYTPDDQVIQKFISTRNSHISNDPESETSIDKELINKYGVKQLLSIPLFGTEGELIGFFEIHNKRNKNNFSNDDSNLLRAVAKNASIAITKSLNYEKLRVAETQLRNSEAELRKLAAQIQYAREAERQRIAREVHDELGQLFTGINLNISLLTELFELDNKPRVEEVLNELHSVQEFVNKGIQIVRDISGSLRSYVLDHLGLIPAVQEYCREIERISNVKCNFESEIESINLVDEKNVALFRIIQEALTNVVRHAEATIINVKIMQLENNLKIIISDNGRGMTPDQQTLTDSVGILGMKERTIFLGGKLVIDSIPQKGTKIVLLIPVDRQH